MDSRMEMDFMGVRSRRINSNQVEKEGNTDDNDNENGGDSDSNNLSLCLFTKSNGGSGIPQISSSSSSGKSNNNIADDLDQVEFNLGSSIHRSATRWTSVSVPMVPDALAETDIQQHKDKAPASGMNMQGLHWTKAATLQEHMSIKNVLEERLVKRKFDWLTTCSVQPVSTADAFKSNKRYTVGLQKSFSFSPTSNDTPEDKKFQLVANVNPNRHFGASPATAQASNDPSSLHHSTGQTSSFRRVKSACLPSNFKERFVSPFKEQQLKANLYGQNLSRDPSSSQNSACCGVPPSLVGNTQASAASNVPGKEASGQLTIFYAGIVNVYDDISPEKAHTIMLLAGNTNPIFAKTTNYSPQRFLISTPLAQNGLARPKTSTVCSSMPNPLVTPQIFSKMQNPCAQQVHTQKSQKPFQPSQSNGLYLGDGEFQSNQTSGATNNQQEPAKQSDSGINSNIIQRALPQARKASLTRFLEKRKERVISDSNVSTHEKDHLWLQKAMTTEEQRKPSGHEAKSC